MIFEMPPDHSGMSPDQAKQIIRNILSYRSGVSYDNSYHERLGTIVSGQGERASVGEEYSWKEIAEKKLHCEYVDGKLESTFFELCKFLKEGLAIQRGEDVKAFCRRVKITKKSFVYFLYENKDVKAKPSLFEGRLVDQQVELTDGQDQLNSILCSLQKLLTSNLDAEEKEKLIKLLFSASSIQASNKRQDETFRNIDIGSLHRILESNLDSEEKIKLIKLLFSPSP